MHAPSVILNSHLPCHCFSVSKGLGMFHKAQNFETQRRKEMAGILVHQFPRMKTGKGKIKIILNQLRGVCNDEE